MAFPKPDFFEGKKVLLLTHSGADVDSIASAAAVFFSLKNKKNAAVGVLDHINLSAKAFAKNTGINFAINPEFSGFEAIVAFDFSDFEMAGNQKEELKKFRQKLFVFDHHSKAKNPLAFPKNSLVVEKAVSTTEVVYNWLKKSGTKIGPKAAECIAAGIIVDSAGFHIADASTFKIMADVFEKSKKTLAQIVGQFEVKRDISENIARLKAARRVRIFKSFDHLVVFSGVGSFEASSAMSFLFLGASVAFAGGENEGKIIVSGRAKSTVVESTGFDLVRDVFVPLGEKFGGLGGGHAGAAAFNAQGKDVFGMLNECVLLTHAFFEKKFGKKSGLKEYR